MTAMPAVQDCVSFNEQVMDHKQETGFSRRLLSARVLAYVRHLEDKKEPKCRPCAATLHAAKESYGRDLSDNWGRAQGSQFLKEYCWAFLDALAERLLQAESEGAQQGMGQMPGDGSRLSTTQVANAIQLGALVMKRNVRPRDGDLECNAEATRVLYDGIQTLIEDQDQMDPEDVEYQCVGFLRTMGIWLEDEAFAREDMDFINRELFPALGRVHIREAPGGATAGVATQNTPPSGRTLLRDLRKDFCEMMNVRIRRTGIFSSVHEVSQDWKHFLQGCHVEVKSVVIELSTQRSPQLKLELVVKQNAAEDLTKAPHSEGASLALQAFYTDAQAYWSVTEDEDKSRCKAVKDWFSLSLLPALIRVMDDMACCAEPLGTAEGLGATLGLAKQGSAMITRTRERIGTKILWEEGVSWERNVLDTEMTEDVTMMKKVVACLETLQPRTEEHNPTKYHVKIDAQILGKKDSSWNGGWRFKMVSEGSE